MHLNFKLVVSEQETMSILRNTELKIFVTFLQDTET